MSDRRDISELSATIPVYESTLKPIPPNIEGFDPKDVPLKDRHLFNQLFELIDTLTPEIINQIQNVL
jgi:hypothetical protein